jgi:selenocysteine lyase/cysteine desulfurase
MHENPTQLTSLDYSKYQKSDENNQKKAVKFNSQLHWAKYKDTRNKVNSELSVQSQKEVFLRQI